MMLTVGKHVQVLAETPASMVAREENSRKKKRYSLWCTCNVRRDAKGHCVHTLAIFQQHIRPTFWPYISPEHTMPSKNGSAGKPVRPRIELEHEVAALRRRVRELDGK